MQRFAAWSLAVLLLLCLPLAIGCQTKEDDKTSKNSSTGETNPGEKEENESGKPEPEDAISAQPSVETEAVEVEEVATSPEEWVQTETTAIDPADEPAEEETEETTAVAATEPAEDTTDSEPNSSEDSSSEDAAAEQAAAMAEVPLIPREAFFGNPDKARARISPDGSRLAFLAPVNGVINVWVAPVGDMAAAKPVTYDTHRGVWAFSWAYTNKHLLYTQDKDGNEQDHVYLINLETDEVTDLTPIEGISAEIDSVSDKFPEEILVGINDRNPMYHDLYKVNLLTGEMELVQENPGFAGLVTDDDYNVRFALNYTPDAGQIYYTPAAEDWEPFLEIGFEDASTTGLAGFNKENDKIYLLDSRGQDFASLKLIDLETGDEVIIAENDHADLSGAIVHPTEKTIQAVSFTYARRETEVLDPAIQADIDFLHDLADGELEITSRTLDDTLWTVAYIKDDGPLEFYLYDRSGEEPKAEFLFVSDSQMAELPLAKMHDVLIPARDGLELVSYLTLPVGSDPDGDGVPLAPLPMVLDVHGGPWARDNWGFNSEHQLWANRGYAVLSVNFRGSSGLGKSFLNAGEGEWAGKMHNDLLDAVAWAAENGIAQRDKVCIMGGSYGGYATLVGMTYTPTEFACGVDIVGPSSLLTLLDNMPPYWEPIRPMLLRRLGGDPATEEGIAELEARSPLFFVDQIERPLLIAQGAHDPRVTQTEADQIVEAMQAKNIPVTYVLYNDEGHGFARPQNRFSFYAITEAFLAEHLGGRYQDIGEAFEDANFAVPAGASDVPGLETALESYTPPVVEEPVEEMPLEEPPPEPADVPQVDPGVPAGDIEEIELEPAGAGAE